MRGASSMSRGLEPATGLSVHAAELGQHDLWDATRDPSNYLMAPAVPMQLVEPLRSNASAAPAAGSVPWGIQAVKADSSSYTGAGITVAVLDTGIDASHPAFAGMNIVEKDFTCTGNGDWHGHGTHCAGTIFGKDVDGARIGVARGVTKGLIGKVLAPGQGDSLFIASAIQWAVENGANVISMSLGIDFPGAVKHWESQGMPTEMAVSKALQAYRLNVALFEALAGSVAARSEFGQPCLF
ncbi:MAG: peptidase S8, partial [Verrucomicrobiaceae bacterium]